MTFLQGYNNMDVNQTSSFPHHLDMPISASKTACYYSPTKMPFIALSALLAPTPCETVWRHGENTGVKIYSQQLKALLLYMVLEHLGQASP